jgi:prepilin peptidase CpaA
LRARSLDCGPALKRKSAEELHTLLFWICIAGFLALMILAALEDIRARRIPNWLTGSVAALYPLYLLATPASVAWPSALGAAFAVFLTGWLLFARGILGGGDVKLITAVTLWAGLEHLALFAAVTSLTGGILAIVSLIQDRWQWRLVAPFASLALATVTSFGRGGRKPPQPAEDVPGQGKFCSPTLPYGIAVAAGGLAVALQLMHA